MKLDKDTVKKLEEVFAIDGSVEEACYYANISRQTYYNWIKGDKELKEKFDRLRQRPVLKARQTVVKSLDDSNNAFRYLEKKKKIEFGNALDVTSGGESIEGFNYIKNDTNNNTDNKTGGSVEETTGQDD